MFNKLGFKKLALSCIISISMILVAASNGYAASASTEPQPCLDGSEPKLRGPAIICSMIITPGEHPFTGEDVLVVTFEANCKGNEFGTLPGKPKFFPWPVWPKDHPDEGLPIPFVELTADDIEGMDLPLEFADDVAGDVAEVCWPNGATEVHISTVTRFNNSGASISANAVVMFWICP